MKIGINLSVLLDRNFSGVGKYTFYIAKYLNELSYEEKGIYVEGLILFKKVDIKDFLNSFDEINTYQKKSVKEKVKELLQRKNFLREMLFRLIDFSTNFINVDTYLEPNFVPFNYKAKRIACFVHDLSFFNPHFHPQYRVERFSYGFIKKTLNSDLIIVPSNFIKNEIIEKFPWVRDKVRVIYHGIDHDVFYPAKDKQIDRKFILFVGNLEPRKNLLGLLKAYSSLPREYKESFPLVIVSRKGWKQKVIFNFIQKSNLWKYIIIKNNIDNDIKLAELYRKAYFLIYPSFYEGFGFPPLEAMACGCPVIVSNKASLPEVCGDNAIYIDPYSIEDITEKMIMAIEKPEELEVLSRNASNYVKKFTWHKSAKEHLEALINM